MGIPKGTKLTETPKEYTIRVRLDRSTLAKLNIVCNKKHMTRSDVLRSGIERQYADLEK